MNLLFKNPVFHKGLNVSVRNGPKWGFLVSPGDEVTLQETGGEVKGTATIILTQTRKFDELPECWLKYEHDPNCRTLDGLEKELFRVYGDSFGPDVTVIFFEVHK